MRYLSVFIPQQPTKPIVVVDLNKPERVSVIDAIYYTISITGMPLSQTIGTSSQLGLTVVLILVKSSFMTSQSGLKAMNCWQN